MEILGCYFPYLILNQGRSHWLCIPTTLALGAFVWLLTLHPAASGDDIMPLMAEFIFYAALRMVALCRSSLLLPLGHNGWGSGVDWCGHDYLTAEGFKFALK